MITERKQELLEENARLRQEVELLWQKVDLLVKRIFGAGSEKLDAPLMFPDQELQMPLAKYDESIAKTHLLSVLP